VRDQLTTDTFALSSNAMRKISITLVILAIAFITASVNEKAGGLGRANRLGTAINRIRELCDSRVASLDSFLQCYPKYFYDSSFPVRERKYEELARYFKSATGFIVYFEPGLYYSKLAGPFHFEKTHKKGFFDPLSDAWLFQGPIGNEPDSMLLKEFSKQDSLDQEDFIGKAALHFRGVLRDCQYEDHLKGIAEPQLFDALRKEIFRISTIDVANSDFIVDEAAIPGLNGSMDSWLIYTGALADALPDGSSQMKAKWANLTARARAFLAANQEFRSFDRMTFIKTYLIPLSHGLTDIQKALDVPFYSRFAATRPDAGDIYDKDVFVTDYFAPDSNGRYSPEKAMLGELLFFDPILSDNNKRACASCHKPNLAFTDGNIKSVSFQFGKLPRNSPTVINSGFQNRLFWDLRAGSLEDQMDSVVNNVDELHGSFRRVIAKLSNSPEYRTRFEQAFPESKTAGITPAKIKYAVGIYERSLTGLNSRFDQYMQGDETKLSRSEINGFNLFMGKARCGVCHFAPLFNGSVPPFYDVSDNHSLGVPIKDSMTKYIVDPDLGLMKISGDGYRRFSFKTPTLRNAALTAPYMHNGVYTTLEQVVNFYDKAAGNQFSKDIREDMTGLPFLTVLPIKLNLTDIEKKDLVAFIKTLTDTSASSKRPARLPRFNPPDAVLNSRTIGGDY
jgi:cytochrome c peroxidase